MRWIKRDAVFCMPFIHVFICWFINFFPKSLVLALCHYRLFYVRPAARTSRRWVPDCCEQKPGTTLSSSRDIVGVDQPTNLSWYRLRLDWPANSSVEKGLALFYYQPKLPFTIFPKFVLPVPQVKGPRPEKRASKRRKKTVVIISYPFKNMLEIEDKGRRQLN